MRPGPITAQCLPPDYGPAMHTIESFVSGRYRSTLEMKVVDPGFGEVVFNKERDRLKKIRQADPESWDPLVVRHLDQFDIEIQREVI